MILLLKTILLLLILILLLYIMALPWVKTRQSTSILTFRSLVSWRRSYKYGITEQSKYVFYVSLSEASKKVNSKANAKSAILTLNYQSLSLRISMCWLLNSKCVMQLDHLININGCIFMRRINAFRQCASIVNSKRRKHLEKIIKKAINKHSNSSSKHRRNLWWIKRKRHSHLQEASRNRISKYIRKSYFIGCKLQDPRFILIKLKLRISKHPEDEGTSIFML